MINNTLSPSGVRERRIKGIIYSRFVAVAVAAGCESCNHGRQRTHIENKRLIVWPLPSLFAVR